MLSADHAEPAVAVVIVNFNNSCDTYECLKSLTEVQYKNYTVILVDNASKQDPGALFSEEFQNVIFVRNQRNLGFTGGNNVGLQKAYELGSKYIFLLNNDTVVPKNILSSLAGFMEKNPRIGLVGPVTLYYDEKDTISFAGGWLNRNTGIVSFLHKGTKFSDLNREEIPCNFVEGSALFLRTDLIREIGGFEDLYFLTSEESELCVRIADRGYDMAILPDCVVWHKVSRSMGAESELSTYFIFRNKLWFIRRNAVRIKIKDMIQLARYYGICLLSFSIKKRNLRAARGLIYGVRDFMLGISGPGRYKEIQ